jgi:hypothetical protein
MSTGGSESPREPRSALGHRDPLCNVTIEALLLEAKDRLADPEGTNAIARSHIDEALRQLRKADARTDAVE